MGCLGGQAELVVKELEAIQVGSLVMLKFGVGPVGPVVLATKRPHPKIGLQLCEVLPARLAALRIVSEGLEIYPELVGDKRKQVRGWDSFGPSTRPGNRR